MTNKLIGSIYGRKYVFETNINQEMLDGLILTFNRKRVNQTVGNFTRFCIVSFNIHVKHVDNVLTLHKIKAKKYETKKRGEFTNCGF